MRVKVGFGLSLVVVGETKASKRKSKVKWVLNSDFSSALAKLSSYVTRLPPGKARRNDTPRKVMHVTKPIRLLSQMKLWKRLCQ